jgi:hypothetical protein
MDRDSRDNSNQEADAGENPQIQDAGGDRDGGLDTRQERRQRRLMNRRSDAGGAEQQEQNQRVELQTHTVVGFRHVEGANGEVNVEFIHSDEELDDPEPPAIAPDPDLDAFEWLQGPSADQETNANGPVRTAAVNTNSWDEDEDSDEDPEYIPVPSRPMASASSSSSTGVRRRLSDSESSSSSSLEVTFSGRTNTDSGVSLGVSTVSDSEEDGTTGAGVLGNNAEANLTSPLSGRYARLIHIKIDLELVLVVILKHKGLLYFALPHLNNACALPGNNDAVSKEHRRKEKELGSLATCRRCSLKQFGGILTILERGLSF